MKRLTPFVCIALVVLLAVPAIADQHMKKGTPQVSSMSALEFGPDGTLFVGDARSGSVFAININDQKTEGEVDRNFTVNNIEGIIAAQLGTTTDEILIHDLAVNPVTSNMFISVSRGRGKWSSRWELPNDLADANVLVRVGMDKSVGIYDLTDVSYSVAKLPNPVAADKMHRWKKGTSTRVDAITDLVFDNGTVYVAGLSNEEFASTMWKLSYPFTDSNSFTTLEIFHGAHGEFETHAPIRAFLPYELNNESHILASYLCTPLVTFKTSDLKNATHVKGKTVAEFGSGNYPLDMVVCKSKDKEFIVVANSMLPLLTFDPADVAAAGPGIEKEVEGYTEGIPYTARAGSGVQQIDNLNGDWVVALQRMPNGHLDLTALSVARLAL